MSYVEAESMDAPSFSATTRCMAEKHVEILDDFIHRSILICTTVSPDKNNKICTT